ncbi:hypothetical protein LBMAG53_21720 [Planctomycetota bacterium]|nr:hypothetical protein LBMAG53_21720 [Planctomycetota bacterium]
MSAGISFRELLTWIGSETDRYESWFSHRPQQVWLLAAGTGRLATVWDLVHHVHVVDIRLAQRAQGQPIATDSEVAVTDAGSLFALGRRGQAILGATVDDAHELHTIISWQTQTGVQMQASRRKIVAHAITHHIRHMAQLATVLRQHGKATDWPHDLLISNAMT